MKRIASPLSEIKQSYDVVVIGSGYGGGVAASRLARAGRTVCLLERGKERLPGEYPSDLTSFAPEVQVDTELGRLGDRSALFDIHMNSDVTALVGCGLGGTSLINANVALEVKPGLFDADGWPKVFRDQPTMLEPYYQRAREVLDPSTYPTSRPTPNKMQALQVSAKRIDVPFERAPINVNFIDKINRFGIYQPACNDCGNCVSGCNFGSKNTTLMNYLPDAHTHGASIFTLASVRHVERKSDWWVVHVESLDPKVPDIQVRAEVVVIAAGSLGSTEILLRSQAHGLALSPMLGEKFSTNGDLLAFGYDNEWKQVKGPDGAMTSAPVYGVGAPDVPKGASQRPGPCITGVIDGRDTPSATDGYVIEEGVIPGALAAVLAPVFFFGEATTGNPLQYGPMDAQVRLESAKSIAEAIQKSPTSLDQYAYSGPVSRTQTYLVMSHDDAGGRMHLEHDRLRIVWPGAGSEQVFNRDDSVLGQVNGAIHGEYIGNPLHGKPMGEQLVTVHPVGGCRMGDDWSTGVVDDRCRVFSAEHEVYDGLYVCDGSVLPGAVAVNPLLTITAVAERSMELLGHDRGWTTDLTMPPARVGHRRFASPRPGHPAVPAAHEGVGKRFVHAGLRALRVFFFMLILAWRQLRKVIVDVIRAIIMWFIHHRPNAVSPGISFTETMEGFIADDFVPTNAPRWEQVSDPFELAAMRGKLAGNEIDFRLIIETDDIYRMTTEADHAADVSGVVHCKLLSAEPMEVTGGHFQLFPPDPDRIDTWLMIYDLPMQRSDGTALHFHGMKHLRRTPTSSSWTDLTKLFVTITESPDTVATPKVVATGILTLDLQDFIRQGSTAKLLPKKRWFNKLGFANNAFTITFLGKFAAFFGTTVLRAYGSLLSDLDDFDRTDDAKRSVRSLTAPKPVKHPISSDGDPLMLTRYQGGTKGPVIFAPGFSVTAGSFAIDTVDTNVVEYLCAHDYDVWLFAYRGSPDSGSSTKPFVIDDVAKKDWPAAVRYVQEVTKSDVQIVAHCVASMTVLMSLLNGLSGVRSLISSQTTVHPVVGWLNDFKADLGIGKMIRNVNIPKLGIDLRKTIDFRSGDKASDKVIDVAVWMLPVPEGEACTNPVCRRVFALWGASYAHEQLNAETHVALREMFGELSTEPFTQLSDIVQRGFAVDVDGNNTYLPNVHRLAMPIDFIAGGQNLLFLPESSQRTYDWLVAHNGEAGYTRRVFAEYAHMDFWIGKNAARDIFPYILQRLDKFN